VIVLAFGLFLNNLHWIQLPWFSRTFSYDNFTKDLNQLTQLSGESAFIVRTFFFLIFGFTLDIKSLLNISVLQSGLVIILLTYLIRILYQRIFVKSASWAEIFLSPRGLISILLFYSTPTSQRIEVLSDGLLFFVILATSSIMGIGLVVGREKKTEPGLNPH
jgi:hypothetical protein